MLQKRLQEGGAERRIRDTQFGFRPRRSTTQALAIVRRMLDGAYAAGQPGLMALFLDWSKASDRIKTESLMSALKRFGLPAPVLELIAAIYRERKFILRDSCGNSSERRQEAGIAQGCPLSPYLFILVQTVLLWDVDSRLQEESALRNFPEEPAYVVVEP